MIDSGSLQNMPAGTTLDIVRGYAPGGMIIVVPGTWVKCNGSGATEHLWCHIKTGDLVHFSWLELCLK